MRHLLLVLTCVFLPNAAWTQEKSGKPILVLNAGGHTSTVNKLLFTPDGKELISVSDDKTIRTWDTSTGEALCVLRPPIGSGFVGQLFAAALSPDGKTLAVADVGGGPGGDNPIYLIALATGVLERTLTGPEDEIWTVAFSGNGKLLASGSRDKTARLWNVATGACTQTFKEHTGLIHGIEFSPDGEQLVSASQDGTGCIWSVKAGVQVAVLKGHDTVKRDGSKTAELKLSKPDEKPLCFTLLPNDRAVVGSNLALYWFDTRTGRQFRTCVGHLDAVHAVAPRRTTAISCRPPGTPVTPGPWMARRRAGGSLTDELVRDLATDDFGILVMCSSMRREFSLESATVGHGFFTLAIVEGLEGKAQRSKEGAICTCNLHAYVTERVKELSRGEQHPVALMPATMRSFPLTKP